MIKSGNAYQFGRLVLFADYGFTGHEYLEDEVINGVITQYIWIDGDAYTLYNVKQ